MDELCNGIENMFVSAYFENLYFQRSFTWVKPIQFCGKKGVRIDRVFECEVQAIPNHSLTIACKFSLYNDKKTYRVVNANDIFYTISIFDTIFTFPD